MVLRQSLISIKMKKAVVFLITTTLLVIMANVYFEHAVSRDCNIIVSYVSTVAIIVIGILYVLYLVKLILKILKIK